MYLLITCGIALLVIIILQNTTYHSLNTSRSAIVDTYIMMTIMCLLYTQNINYILLLL